MFNLQISRADLVKAHYPFQKYDLTAYQKNQMEVNRVKKMTKRKIK